MIVFFFFSWSVSFSLARILTPSEASHVIVVDGCSSLDLVTDELRRGNLIKVSIANKNTPYSGTEGLCDIKWLQRAAIRLQHVGWAIFRYSFGRRLLRRHPPFWRFLSCLP